MSAIENTIPISQFNRGLAGKIFDDVSQTGPKVVMKNNVPTCVLISPEEYVEMMDALEDAKLLAAAEDRLANAKSDDFISEDAMNQLFGITEDDLADADSVEIE